MGTYATSADVIARLGETRAAEITADTPGDPADDVLIDTVIGEVEGVVSGFVQRRMSVPVSAATYPRMALALRGVVVAMTRYSLATRRPPVPVDWKADHDNAMEWLKGLADGSIDPPDDTAVGTEAAWGSETPVAGQLVNW